ncbi:MAG TPA: AmmeMemoRadiSam system protein B [Thermodesulfovibrionales bacterium]|nr:AmmeMemoRadiSam system protein B [Thermodesulfovibrionales bacterium]
MRRRPAVAGQFYHGTSVKLNHQVQQYVDARNPAKQNALGILSPHAGLIYSGSVAGSVYSQILFPETFILIGPNHTGLGAHMALMDHGEWEIPTGVLNVDERLSRKILANVPMVSSDTQAHLFEHSLEVQLPFITYFSKETKIVPLTIMSATPEDCKLLGEGIAKSIREVPYPVVIVASSDMSHYLSDDTARRKDKMAIDRMVSLDPEGLYRTVKREEISMCGYLPATVMLHAVKSLGASVAKLIRYATSAEVSGDYDHVVGYAGIIIS